MKKQITTLTFEETKSMLVSSGNHLLRNITTPENPAPFFLKDQISLAYSSVFEYFMGDNNFLKRNASYSLRKGLLIIGGVGTGKTTMMQVYSCIMKNKNNTPCFEVKDSHSIVREFLTKGFATIDKYSSEHYFVRGNPKGLCIDDLGMEDSKSKSFGNDANVMEQILYERYKRFISDGMITHGTSNLNAAALGEKYGARVKDRFNEMFNTIILNGESLRK